jgi:hypothetical protein
MAVKNVDLVILLDCSKSMRPCFDQIKNHLKELLQPLQNAKMSVRFGLLGYSATSKSKLSIAYSMVFLGGDDIKTLLNIYSESVNPDLFFTQDAEKISTALDRLACQGDEDALLSLDTAIDFPFGSLQTTRRVISLFTDEKIENGVNERTPLAKIQQIIDKLTKRKISLFAFCPQSAALDELATADSAEITYVESGDGLQSVDFKKLMQQMGKSLSIPTMQSSGESPWERALFGQDKFSETTVENWSGD